MTSDDGYDEVMSLINFLPILMKSVIRGSAQKESSPEARTIGDNVCAFSYSSLE